nr:transcription factor Adf-1-like [Leptinotarsa decemlineata]
MSGQQEDVQASISFVKLVEQNPCLWNYTLKSYCRTDFTGVAWKEIAKKLKETEQNCRDRWKNIRTAYGRSLKPPKSGSGGKSKKPYYLATHLDFLRPYMKGASTSGNVPPEEDTQGDEGTLDTTETQVEEGLSDTPQAPSVDEVSVDNETDIHQEPRPRKKRKIITLSSDADKAFIGWLDIKKNKAQTPSEQEKEDSDWLFFRSLLPDFKKLGDRRKRGLKIKFATLLNEELDLAEAETSNTPCS